MRSSAGIVELGARCDTALSLGGHERYRALVLRRLLSALAAVALASQAMAALTVLAEAPHVCCCPRRGTGHHCDCPDCAEHRSEQAGQSSVGCCGGGGGPMLLSSPLGPFLPALQRSEPATPLAAAPEAAPALPPRAPARDVPTPPPLLS